MIKSANEVAPLFIRLMVKEKLRSLSFGRDLVSAGIKVFFITIILLYLVGAGLFLEFILSEIVEIDNIPSFLSRTVLFYLFMELIVRLLFQKNPVVELGKFLHLPVSRSGIVHFLLGKSLVSIFSLIAIFLFLPISLSQIGPAYGTPTAIAWVGNLVVLSFSLHWIVLLLNKTVIKSLPGLFGVILIACLPLFLAYYGIVNIGEYASPFFSPSFLGAGQIAISLFLCFLSYRLVFGNFVINAYLDQKKPFVPELNLNNGKGFFARFGEKGVLLDAELKLIFRHKKSRNYLFLSFIFIFYFYFVLKPSDSLEAFAGFQLFFSLGITGAFALNYGQFTFSWNTPFFDFYMMKKGGLKDLVRIKLYILYASCIILYICSMPFLYYGWHLFLVLTAAVLFNLGVGIPILVLMSLWKPKPMDIHKSAFFNYEGIGLAQFLMTLPYLLIPLVIYLSLSYLFDTTAALAGVGVAGLTGLIFRSWIVRYTANTLNRNRYKIASTFRRGTV